MMKPKSKDQDSSHNPKVPNSPWTLYRYSNPSEKFLMFISVIFGIIDGAGPALMTIIFGAMSDTLIDTLRLGLKQDDSTSNDTSIIINPIDNGTSSVLDNNNNNNSMTSNNRTLLLSGPEFESLMTRFAYGYIALGIIVYISSTVQITCWQIVCERVIHRARKAFMRSILRQELAWFDKNQSGNLAVKLNDDIERYRDGAGEQMGVLIKQFSTFICGFVVGFVKSWRLTLVILSVTPLLAILTGFVGRMMATSTIREQEKYASAGALAEEALTSIRTIFALNGQSQEVAAYKKSIEEGKAMALSKYVKTAIAFGMSFVVLYSTYGLGLYVGAIFMDQGQLTPGQTMAVIMAVMLSSSALGNVLPPVQLIAQSISSASLIYEIIESVPEIDAYSDRGLRLSKVMANIRFDKVSFSYPIRPGVEVLKQLSFEVGQGKTLAICGRTGSGKSTVMNLLLRFYDPSSGSILLDECDLRDLNLSWLRSLIGTVEQEPALFDASIYENIALGASRESDNSRERVIEAAKVANVHDFIMQLPQQYDTRCGDRGVQMSGGQRQRIAIARALLRDPKILLLDEATSALDSANEGVVQQALNKARKGRTTIIIAHRLSTIRDADRIMVMEAGNFVESGTHDELMEKRALYHDLVTNQVFASDTTGSPQDLSPSPSSGDDDLAAKAAQEAALESQDQATDDDDDDESGQIIDHSLRSSFSQTPETDGRLLQESIMTVKTTGSSGQQRRRVQHHHQKRRISTNMYETVNKQRAAELKLASSCCQDAKDEFSDPGLRGLLWLMRKERTLIITGLLASIFFGMLVPVFGILYAQILDTLSKTGDELFAAARFWALIFVLLGLLNMIGVGLRIVLFCELIERSLARVRIECFTTFMRQQVGWFDMPANAPQRLTTRLATDAPAIKSAFNARVGSLVSGVATIIFSMVFVFILGWQLAMLLVIVLPVLLSVGYLQMKMSRGSKAQQAARMEGASRLATEAIEHVKVIQTINKEEHFCKLFEHELREPFRDSMRSARSFGLFYGLSQSCIYFVYAAAFRWGAFLIVRQQMNAIDVFREFFTVSFTATTVGQWGGFSGDYQRANESLGRIIRLLKTKSTIDNMSRGGIMPKLRGAITLRDVHFSYPSRPDMPVLRGISLYVEPGQTVALVGASGNGKSTITSLLLRFYDPDRGSVLIDDFDVRCINLNHLRLNVGLVSQEPCLFRGSIRENILFGLEHSRYSMRDVIRVAKMANIHEFISNLPLAYDTQVGERGCQLSGGQKQRIAIARTMIRNPTILILDEATSALDSESEKLVDEALERASKGKTCIKIAHRLCTVREADQIAVMDSGCIVEMGTHAELMAIGKRGHYFRLMQKQEHSR